jgi:hypothetical protein
MLGIQIFIIVWDPTQLLLYSWERKQMCIQKVVTQAHSETPLPCYYNLKQAHWTSSWYSMSMKNWENGNGQVKTEVLREKSVQCYSVAKTNPIWTTLGLIPILCREIPVTNWAWQNRLTYKCQFTSVALYLFWNVGKNEVMNEFVEFVSWQEQTMCVLYCTYIDIKR